MYVCGYALKGKCHKGSADCKFFHVRVEDAGTTKLALKASDKSNLAACFHFQTGACSKEQCPYLHVLRATN